MPKVLTAFATNLPKFNRRWKELSTNDAKFWFELVVSHIL
jgi:hypothetical protein